MIQKYKNELTKVVRKRWVVRIDQKRKAEKYILKLIW